MRPYVRFFIATVAAAAGAFLLIFAGAKLGWHEWSPAVIEPPGSSNVTYIPDVQPAGIDLRRLRNEPGVATQLGRGLSRVFGADRLSGAPIAIR